LDLTGQTRFGQPVDWPQHYFGWVDLVVVYLAVELAVFGGYFVLLEVLKLREHLELQLLAKKEGKIGVIESNPG
jgi:hypothetical protein